MPTQSIAAKGCHQYFVALILLALLTTAPLAGATAQGRGAGQPPATPPASAIATMGRIGPIIVDGMLQPVAEFADTTQIIRQRVWVETDFDSDRDGKLDRIHVDVTRPGAAERAGLKVPTIMRGSPYIGPTNGTSMWNVEHEIGAVPPVRVPVTPRPFVPDPPPRATAINWVQRGFASVAASVAGTGLSTGCPSAGHATERNSPKFAIDWLNGRAKGYTTVDGYEEVVATTWSSGKVGMTGTSYDGAIPMAAAVTGVEGLEAIIPIAPNTSNYRYYRSYGLVRSPGGYVGEDADVLFDFVHSGRNRETCNAIWREGIMAQQLDRITGDFNDFWEERDQTLHIANVKAAVLFAHGFNDWNVMPDNTTRMWDALKQLNPKSKIFMHQGGHGGGPPTDIQNMWWAHYLYGVNNGVDTLPRAMIVSSTSRPVGGGRGSGPPTFHADYPVPGSALVAVHPRSGGGGVGTLALNAAPGQGSEKLVDDWNVRPAAMATAASSPNRLLYALPAFTDSLHLSGTAVVTLRLASSKPAANLSVYLVTLPFDPANIGSAGQVGVVTRGWADPQNHKSLTSAADYLSKERGVPLAPGTFYTMTFPLQPDDQIIMPGQQLGVMIFSSDAGFTLRPSPGTELTVDLNATSVQLPIVGGAAALRRALGGR